jgi:hypothetical protein
VLYLLERWREEEVFRGRIVYDLQLVRAAQEQRRLLEERARARCYAWALHPFVGLFPEEEQIRRADRLGLDPAATTMAGALFEALLAGGFLWLLARLTEGAVALVLPFVALFLGVVVVGPALSRLVAALLFQEVSGSGIFALASKQGGRASEDKLDPRLVPLTRDAFWARLRLPDRQSKQADGTVLVESQLAHLSWVDLRRVGVRGDWWSVITEPPRLHRGQIVYIYRLVPIVDSPLSVEPELPPPDAYAIEVRSEIERLWDELISLGGGALVSLLPARTQERALRHRGGHSVVRTASWATTLATLALGVIALGTRAPVFMVLGTLFVIEGCFRSSRLLQHAAAPSFIGRWLTPWVSPDRDAYHAHREFERRALSELESSFRSRN